MAPTKEGGTFGGAAGMKDMFLERVAAKWMVEGEVWEVNCLLRTASDAEGLIYCSQRLGWVGGLVISSKAVVRVPNRWLANIPSPGGESSCGVTKIERTELTNPRK